MPLTEARRELLWNWSKAERAHVVLMTMFNPGATATAPQRVGVPGGPARARLAVKRVQERLEDYRVPIFGLEAWQRRILVDFECPFCQQRGKSRKAVQLHVRSICTADVWACCGRLFETAEALDTHVARSHGF